MPLVTAHGPAVTSAAESVSAMFASRSLRYTYGLFTEGKRIGENLAEAPGAVRAWHGKVLGASPTKV